MGLLKKRSFIKGVRSSITHKHDSSSIHHTSLISLSSEEFDGEESLKVESSSFKKKIRDEDNYCLDESDGLDLNKICDNIPQYSKSDLVVCEHLGKGAFSDVFEVKVMVVKETQTAAGDNLDRLIEAKFASNNAVEEDDGDDLDKEIDAMFGSLPSNKNAPKVGNRSLACYVSSLAQKNITEVDGDEDDLDLEIDAIFGASPGINYTPKPNKVVNRSFSSRIEVPKVMNRRLGGLRSSSRRATSDRGVLSTSMSMGNLPSAAGQPKRQQMKFAMKCLRPQIRANLEQFEIGIEDLVHETAMLASLDHPNIVKIHGRAACGDNSFHRSNGYFILLDRLADTLDVRIDRWKKNMPDMKNSLLLTQMKTASSIADAIAYLHSKNIVFRDLKPDNVGFDSMGVLKLFDFGFAISVDEEPSDSSDEGPTHESHLLYDKCGTPRYMAPEVALQEGYSFPADVYSFGILLWEICALKKPWSYVKSADEYHKAVFEKGARPKLKKCWPQVVTDIMTNCWSSSPSERPTMDVVKSIFVAHVREVASSQQSRQQQSNVGVRSLRQSFRRFTD